MPRKDYGQAFGTETCIILPSLQINYDADFFNREWTHYEISSLQVSAAFITGLCNHSFVLLPIVNGRTKSANMNVFLTDKICKMPSRD